MTPLRRCGLGASTGWGVGGGSATGFTLVVVVITFTGTTGVCIWTSGGGMNGGGGVLSLGGGGGCSGGNSLVSSMILVSTGSLITSTTLRARPVTSAYIKTTCSSTAMEIPVRFFVGSLRGCSTKKSGFFKI